MTIHKIVIELDVAPGMESSICDTAHHAIVRLDEETQANADRILKHVRLFSHVAEGKMLPPVVQDIVDRLNAHVKRNRMAADCVVIVLSEISHAMSTADSEYRRKQATTAPPQPSPKGTRV